MTPKQKARLEDHKQNLNIVLEELNVKEFAFEVGEDENFNPVYIVWNGKKFLLRCGKKEKEPDNQEALLKMLDHIYHELGERYGK